ncbi:MAG TPA: hypothetical protein ENK19_01325 [Acidobacteria bacterium]|nr:hypothetical protein [Acidobacteriota bacterium]
MEGDASSRSAAQSSGSSGDTGQVQDTADFGTLLIDAPVFDFQIATPFRPTALYLNPFMQVPLVAVSRDFNPMFADLFEGLRQAAGGNLGMAEQLFRRITDTCDHLEPENSFARRIEDECAVASMAAHIHLGEIALTWANVTSAERHVASARKALARVKDRHRDVKLPSPPSIEVLAARVDLANGDPDTARARLSAITGQRHPLTADGYAVLAVAAALSGHAEQAARARRAAQVLGVAESGSSPPVSAR